MQSENSNHVNLPKLNAHLLLFQMYLPWLKAFDEKTSRDLTWWDIGARAAMGLCFVNPPNGFKSRHVVPVKKAGSYYKIQDDAKLHHLPNLYCQVDEIEKKFLPVDQIIEDK